MARLLSAMLRLLLRNALLLTLLAALPIFLIRAQPYDDSELRAFLTPPEDCPAPCFMGIRPGVTTLEEAIAILEGHEWVNFVNVEFHPSIWEIHLSGHQPAWIQRIPFHLSTHNGEGKVSGLQVYLASSLTVGDLYSALGEPSGFLVYTGSVGSYMLQYIEHIYLNHSVVFRTMDICPVNQTKFLSSRLKSIEFISQRSIEVPSGWQNMLYFHTCY